MNEFTRFEFDVTNLAFRLLGERAARYRNQGLSWKLKDLDRRNTQEQERYSSALKIVFFDRHGFPVRAIDQVIFQYGRPVNLNELERELCSELDRMATQN